MNKYIYIFSIIIGWFIIACNTKNNNQDIQIKSDTVSNNAIIPVKTTWVKKGNFYQELVCNGKIEAKSCAKLHFKISEQIADIYFKEGDFVKKGDLIAKLQQEKYKNDLQQAKNQYNKAVYDLNYQLIDFGYKGIEDSANVPDNIMHTVKIKSGYNEAKINLKQNELYLSYTYLYAPFSGNIANLTFKPYNTITTADVFCTLIDNASLEVVFSILETEKQFVNINQPIHIKILNTDTITYKGIVKSINPLVDNNGLIQIKADIINPTQAIIQGMNVSVLLKQKIPDKVVIPKSALITRSDKAVVFTYDNGFAKWNYVSVIAENTTSYCISSGLPDSAEVIINKQANIAHDARVKRLKTN